MIEDVRAYHKKFGLLVHDAPVHLTRRKLAERANFMLEELREFAEAAGLVLEPIWSHPIGDDRRGAHFVVVGGDGIDQDLEGQADALVDLVYVALSTAVQLGLPWMKLWDDVHRANMAKVRGDSVKPSGWKPPTTRDVLRAAGYIRYNFSEGLSASPIADRYCKDDER